MDELAAAAFRRHYRQIFRFVRRRSSSHEDAEDVTAEVFAAVAALRAFEVGATPLLAWLYTVARRRLADDARRRARSPQLTVADASLDYFQRDPVYRRFHHHQLTFSLMYAFSENFVLPLSHDEVVHGKGSLYSKMPGDRWQKLANLRALLAFMWAHPGKKLLFMGGELAQEQEWSHDRSLDWHLLEQAEHAGVQALVRELNRIYREEAALWERDHDPSGFRWLEANDAAANVLAFARYAKDGECALVCVCNLSPVPREGYRLGLPQAGRWREALNTDSTYYGGSDVGNLGGVESEAVPWHEQPFSAEVTLPPLGVVWLVPE